MPTQVVTLDWETWNHAPWKDAFDASVKQYLAKSGEEITEKELWTVFASAMLGQADLLLLAALDQDTLFGWCLCRVQAGTAITGPLIYLWQVWVDPRRAKVTDLWRLAQIPIKAWARNWQSNRLVMLTSRLGPGYKKILSEMGFEPYAVIYQQRI